MCKSDKISYEGSKIEGITSQLGLQQLINEPTHHTRNSSSCIDLMFTSQENLALMESGVQYSLHENCHHQIIYTKFNLRLYYPSSYEREIWHYHKVNIENIREVIDQFPWAMRFTNINVNERVNLFKDSHREKALSNKTPALSKSRNICIYVVGTSNQLFIRGS